MENYNKMTISDVEAARTLIMFSRSSQPMKQSVVKTLEKEGRVSSSSRAMVEYVDKEDPLMASPTTLARNGKKRSPLFPPMEKQPTKAKRKTGQRLPARASSSGTREPTPESLLALMTSKNGAEPKKIIEKLLNATDVSVGHNRLSMPFSNIIDLEFLSPEEERIIEEHSRKILKKGVDAKLVSCADLREYDVNLRRWDMKKKTGSCTSVYNLVTGWNKVVEGCGLKKDDKFHLWSFHSNGKLYFALAPPSSHSDES